MSDASAQGRREAERSTHWGLSNVSQNASTDYERTCDSIGILDQEEVRCNAKGGDKGLMGHDSLRNHDLQWDTTLESSERKACMESVGTIYRDIATAMMYIATASTCVRLDLSRLRSV